MTETWAACYTLCRRLILLYRGVEVSQCDYVVISVGANHMVKNLTKHGNSLALIIDYGVLDLLDIDAAPPSPSRPTASRWSCRRSVKPTK